MYKFLLQKPEKKADKAEVQKVFGKEFSIALKNGMRVFFKLNKNELCALENKDASD